MRSCPICLEPDRTLVFSMNYHIPDGWPLPDRIDWYTCDRCNMFYGDGDFNQALLNRYYQNYYGYGVLSPDNAKRLEMDSTVIGEVVKYNKQAVIVDFGGAGDDGECILANEMKRRGYINVLGVGPNEELPENCDLIYASHVLEHIYDLPEAMNKLTSALAESGTLVIDVPDATGLLQHWKKPILDFNTKHINHFTLRNLLDLGYYYGLELVNIKKYELEVAPAFQVQFRFLDMAQESAEHVQKNMNAYKAQLDALGKLPVNLWGMSDIVWHVLSKTSLNILDYIDNDPAYRGQTYDGKPVLERPTNDAPIVIMAQGQRQRLIENIRLAGITNPIIEIGERE